MELNNFVAIITGASGGLVRAIAERFFEEGAFLVLWSLHQGSLDKVAVALDPEEKPLPGKPTLRARERFDKGLPRC